MDDHEKGVVTSLARGLSILQCFTPEHTELGPTDIARMLGLPQPTVWRLCQTLRKAGFLTIADNPDKLCIGDAILRLGQAVASTASLVDYAYPLMREIALRFGASVSLSARFGPDMLIVQRATGDGILQLNLHVGSSYEVMNSASGWAYLCGLAPSERRAVLEEIRGERSDRFAEHLTNFKKILTQYDSEGHVVAIGKMHSLVNAVGVPVISADRRRVMALNLGGVSVVCTPELLGGEVSVALKDLAAKLGARLGTLREMHYPRR